MSYRLMNRIRNYWFREWLDTFPLNDRTDRFERRNYCTLQHDYMCKLLDRYELRKYGEVAVPHQTLADV